MRLLVVSWWMPYPPDNGTKQRAYNLLKRLSQRHSITLLAFGEPRQSEDVKPLRQWCESVCVVPPRTLEAGRLGMSGLLSPIPRYYAQTTNPEMTALVDRTLPGHDAVMALTCGAALHVLEAAATTPSVLDEIEVSVPREQYVLEQRPLRRLRQGLTWWKFQRFTRNLAERFDRSTVVSGLEQELLRAIGCDMRRVAVIPNGVNLPEFTPIQRRARRLIYPGSVMYSANLDAVQFFITQVFPVVRRAAPDVIFMVTGATDGVDLRALAATEGVTFTGRLPDVDALLAQSAACVVPLRIGGGTRLKVLHAMAVSTPVVTTSKGIEGLDVEPDRHALVADSPEMLAAQILRIIDDPVLCSRLTSAGRSLVSDRYTWDASAEALDRVIQGAVEDHRSKPDSPHNSP